MQNKDLHRFNIGLNKDDNPADLQPGEYTDALNMRVASSEEQQGIGIMETLQGEVELIIDAILPTYYGGSIGGGFVYEGYESVTIGTQTWMKKNYARNYFGSKVYGDIEANRDIYGGLYNWQMIHQPGFCPDGWKIASLADWLILFNHLGGQATAGGKLKVPGEVRWLAPNTDAVDSYGFSALGAGKYGDFGYELLKTRTQFWLYDEIVPSILIHVVIVTSIDGEFEMTLTGDGFIYIDWGDGVGQMYFLDDVPIAIKHTYLAGGGTINIYNCSHLKSIVADEVEITSITISPVCTSLEKIDLSSNLLTSISLQTWKFGSLTDYAEIDLSDNLLTAISVPYTWRTNAGKFDISNNNLIAISMTYLSRFGTIDISNNNINNIVFPTGTVLWQSFIANDNSLINFIVNTLTIADLEILDLRNNELLILTLPASLPKLRILNASENLLDSVTPYATWGTDVAGQRNYDFLNNNLISTSVSLFLTTFDAVTGVGEWRLGDRLDLSGTNAAPDGSGMTSYYHLITQDAIVLINLLAWGSVIDLLDFLWIGEIESDHLISATDGRRIAILVRDFATNYIPYSSGSLFVLESSPDFILDDEDNLWFTGAGVQEQVTTGDLVDFNYHRTVVRYSDSPPYEITAIGIIKSGIVLTDAQIELLAEAFLLDIFWGDTP